MVEHFSQLRGESHHHTKFHADRNLGLGESKDNCDFVSFVHLHLRFHADRNLGLGESKNNCDFVNFVHLHLRFHADRN